MTLQIERAISTKRTSALLEAFPFKGAKARSLLLAVTLLGATSANALIIDFEATPAIPTGPSLYQLAGPAQTITYGGVTFSGGVVLGFPTYFPASIFSTSPNVYGTASPSVVSSDPSLAPIMRIGIDPALSAGQVEGVLFNGMMSEGSFTMTAFSNGVPVDQRLFRDVPSNLDSGNVVFRLASRQSPIDLVTITPDLSGLMPGDWNYVIDTVAIGEPIENALPVPEPSTYFLTGMGLSLLAFATKRKRGRTVA